MLLYASLLLPIIPFVKEFYAFLHVFSAPDQEKTYHASKKDAAVLKYPLAINF